MRAFRWSWAVPERSGDVAGGSRARIIDFALVLGGFDGGAPRVGNADAGIVRPPKARLLRERAKAQPKGKGNGLA